MYFCSGITTRIKNHIELTDAHDFVIYMYSHIKDTTWTTTKPSISRMYNQWVKLGRYKPPKEVTVKYFDFDCRTFSTISTQRRKVEFRNFDFCQSRNSLKRFFFDFLFCCCCCFCSCCCSPVFVFVCLFVGVSVVFVAVCI